MDRTHPLVQVHRLLAKFGTAWEVVRRDRQFLRPLCQLQDHLQLPNGLRKPLHVLVDMAGLQGISRRPLRPQWGFRGAKLRQ